MPRRKKRKKTNVRQLRQRIRFWTRRGYTLTEASALASMNINVSSGKSQVFNDMRRELIRRRRDLLRMYSSNGLSNAQIWKILDEVRVTFTIREEIFQLSPTLETPERRSRANLITVEPHDPATGAFESFPDNEADVIDTLEYIDSVAQFDQNDRLAFQSWQRTQEVISRDDSIEDIRLADTDF